ncbi:DUF397 domain-containing protein [Streptomyces sp. NBC_00487]|uniref:DUF397 domain-containing protein n=1 Tax=unclassified Streptomyces TaxID=2593676 RepID=UPI002E16F727|nr:MULTISPECIES: DUF397 domain-containing protein [unclassified Streptomyces]
MESNAVPAGTRWRRSRHSSDQGGDCVEVAAAPSPSPSPSPTVAVRDSKNPVGPRLTLTPAAFSAFLGWVSSAHTA